MCVYTCVVEISEWPRIVCTVRRSAPFSTIWVAHECRSMCGDACRPEVTDAAPTICHTRCRDSLRPPRAMNNKGEFFVEIGEGLTGFFAALDACMPDSIGRPCARYSDSIGRPCARYSDSASCAGLPRGTMRSL